MGFDKKLGGKLFRDQITEEQTGRTYLPEDAPEEEVYFHGAESHKESKYANKFEWYIAEKYETTPDDQIKIKKLGNYKAYPSLEDPDLFLSFIRTGNSEELFDEQVKTWVDNHGLLQSGYLQWMKAHGRIHRNSPGDLSTPVTKDELREANKERLNQTPISIYSFKKEVREARSAAELYCCLYNRNFSTIAEWANNLPDILMYRELDQIEEALLPREGVSYEQSKTLSQNRIRSVVTDFQIILTQKISEVQLSLPTSEPMDFSVSDRQYLPRISYDCPDLWSAIWLQFYLAVAERLPSKRCANPGCQLPFIPKKRSDAKTCSRACRIKICRNRKKLSL